VRFAEVFLRLGSSLVGWMMVYTWLVWMAALHAMSCGPEGDEMHRVLLGLAPFTVVMGLLLRMTRPLPDVHRLLARLGIPLLLLLPFAVRNIWNVFDRTNIDGLAICSANTAATTDQIWAPAQFLVLVVLAFLVIRIWRDGQIEKT
jgi:hypothetical protein